ncbi:MAG: PHP domain-containing protein [Desulfomonile tiedjei]|nr:PHP domain-containing protein [Desulfomonile tiedjei]
MGEILLPLVQNGPLPPGRPGPVKLEFVRLRDVDFRTPAEHHVHTTYTDAEATVQEVVQAARSRGIAEILLSDHVRHDSKYFPSLVAEVRSLQVPGTRPYVGVETKVLDSNGTLDCSRSIAAACDAIIGSVHGPPPNESGGIVLWKSLDAQIALKLEFALAMAIVSNSRAHILGHPMGMVIKHFGLAPIGHLYELACACRKHEKAFELNARYCLSPVDWLDVVDRARCKVTFGSDAHTSSEVGRAWSIFVQSPDG